MDAHVKKAWQLVSKDKVALTYRSPDGQILSGLVRSTQVYTVTVDPAGSWCDCTYGRYQPGKHHSHTLALQLQDKVEHPAGK